MKAALKCVIVPFALVSEAHAQSNVTLFGLLDVGVSYVSNENDHQNLKVDDSIWTPSIWGIRGIEDLDGGYKTVFELASQFSPNSGAGIPGPMRTLTARHSSAWKKTDLAVSRSDSSTT